MDRRNFLTKTGAVIGTAIATPKFIFAGQLPLTYNETVEKVHVIFKTHLDIGFTDLASNVINLYFDHFIPNVLSLTEQIDRDRKEDRYIWTTGSWLVYRYLEEAAPENRRRMERAIERGDFVWNGMPFTTDTELMEQSLLRLATTYSARLDQRFQHKTIAAKMTDVPGHCRGMIPVMAEAGLELLHIGANQGAAELEVPPLFLWKSPDGSELMVMYQHTYGDVAVLPGGQTAVSICFTNDNLGPHSLQQIGQIYGKLREQFPKAKVFASDLNTVALEIRQLKQQLPVVFQEIGDTWIYGTGSEPLLMAQYRELSRLRREWIAKGTLQANGDIDAAFGERFLCIPEHTWGTGNTHSHLDIYDMAAFRTSRNLPEFRLMERSWAEKHDNIDIAIGTLPVELAAEADSRLKSLRPVQMELGKLQKLNSPTKVQDTKHFRIGFDAKTGAICYLEHRESGRQWAGPSNSLGLFSYQTFSQPDFDHFMDQYIMPKLRKAGWAIDSWGRPGLDKTSAKSGLYFTTLRQLWHKKLPDGHLFLAELGVPDAGDSGCPHEIIIETFLPDNESIVKVTLKWFNKEASRLPEALWFSFIPLIQVDGQFEMDKMGQAVSPMDVVKGGNRNLHGVISGVSYKDKDNGFQLETLDAFLVAPGRRSMLIFDNKQPDMTGGLHFCLFNNLFSVNWRLWFEEDMQFRFVMKYS